MWSIKAQSFKRLYENGTLTKEQLIERVDKTITKEEYEYITGEELNYEVG